MRRGALRRFWVAFHKWVGLTLGLLLALLGLTGSFNVFTRELDVATHPAFYHVTAAARPVSADTAIAAMQAAAPVSFIETPNGLVPTWIGYTERRGDLWAVSVDPGTGHVLGLRNLDATIIRTIYELHADLLLERFWGEQFVGILGLVLLASTVSGVWLWWPKRRLLAALVQLRRRPRQILYLDLHALAGVWTAVILALVAVTGVGVVFPWMIRPAVGVVSHAAMPAPPLDPHGGGPFRIDADRVVAIAHRAAPREDVSYLEPPSDAHPLWVLGLRWRDVNAAYMNAGELSIDPWTGALLLDNSAEVQTAGQRVMDMQLWLHSGAVFGWTGRIAVFASGIALAALYVTGVLLWLRKARLRRRARAAIPVRHSTAAQ